MRNDSPRRAPRWCWPTSRPTGRIASQEWGRYGVVANAILPTVKTPAFENNELGRAGARFIEEHSPVGRFGTPYFGTPYEDCSPMLAFLSSEAAGYINGQVIGIAGGLTLFA